MAWSQGGDSYSNRDGRWMGLEPQGQCGRSRAGGREGGKDTSPRPAATRISPGSRERRTRLLQLGNVDQGTVLGAAEHFLQPLQAHLHLALCCHLLQHLLHLLGVEGCAAQEPVQGTHQCPAQTNALLCSAMAAARREKRNRGPSCTPTEIKAWQWGSLRSQTTPHTPSPACSAPGSSAAASSPRASPLCQGKSSVPSADSSLAAQLQETFQASNQIILLRKAQH